MITGFGVHDRPEWPFMITGMRNISAPCQQTACSGFPEGC